MRNHVWLVIPIGMYCYAGTVDPFKNLDEFKSSTFYHRYLEHAKVEKATGGMGNDRFIYSIGSMRFEVEMWWGAPAGKPRPVYMFKLTLPGDQPSGVPGSPSREALYGDFLGLKNLPAKEAKDLAAVAAACKKGGMESKICSDGSQVNTEHSGTSDSWQYWVFLTLEVQHPDLYQKYYKKH